MFDNIHKKINIPNQEVKEGIVQAKKRGRPFLPNMEKVSFRLDKALHAACKNYAVEIGVNKSSVVALALTKFLESKKREKEAVKIFRETLEKD